MGPNDVSPYEMSDFPNISDSDIEALRAGRVPASDERLGDIARFLEDFASAVPEPSTAHLEADHLSAMFDAAHLMADNGDPAAVPGSTASGPDERASGAPKPRRKTVFEKLVAAPLAAKIGAGAAAVMLAFSGVAVAGALPAPVQNVVADAVAVTGIDLPGGADEAAEAEQEAAEQAAEEAAAADEAAQEAVDEAAEAAEAEAEDAEDADEAAEAEDEDDAEDAVSEDNDDQGDDEQDAVVNEADDEDDSDNAADNSGQSTPDSDDEPETDTETDSESD